MSPFKESLIAFSLSRLWQWIAASPVAQVPLSPLKPVPALPAYLKYYVHYFIPEIPPLLHTTLHYSLSVYHLLAVQGHHIASFPCQRHSRSLRISYRYCGQYPRFPRPPCSSSPTLLPSVHSSTCPSSSSSIFTSLPVGTPLLIHLSSVPFSSTSCRIRCQFW